MINKKYKRRSLIETYRILQEKLQQMFMNNKLIAEEIRQLKKDVNTDVLTGLYNRRYFNQILVLECERVLRYNNPLSLLFIDVDDFKHYNDVYGHKNGDFVLVKIGDIFHENLRGLDFGFRYGGEEFAILLPGINLSNALIVAEKIRRLFVGIEFKPKNSDHIVKKTVSIGVAEFKQGMDVNEFVNQADKAMYKAKKLGKNRVCVFE